MDSDRRAETMAQYLEQVQWAVRQTRAAPETPHLGEDLSFFLSHILPSTAPSPPHAGLTPQDT